jgi:hypothetical protein
VPRAKVQRVLVINAGAHGWHIKQLVRPGATEQWLVTLRLYPGTCVHNLIRKATPDAICTPRHANAMRELCGVDERDACRPYHRARTAYLDYFGIRAIKNSHSVEVIQLD